MNYKRNKFLFTSIISALCLYSGIANSDLIASSNNNVGNAWFGDAVVDLPLTLTGTRQMSFTVHGTESRRLLITFTSQCNVDGNSKYSYVDIDIEVDGQNTLSTNTNNPLCRTDNDPISSQPETHTVTTATLPVAPGTHTLKVRGQLISNDGTARAEIRGIFVSISD